MEDWASHHVKLWIAEITGRDAATILDSEKLSHLWIGSINVVEYAMLLEDELKLEIPHIGRIGTVGDLIQFVRDSKRN